MSGRIRRKKLKETLKTIKRFRSEYGIKVSYTSARNFVRHVYGGYPMMSLVHHLRSGTRYILNK